VAIVLAGFMVGFCKVELKPFGPVHTNVEPGVLDAVKLSALPEQIGELLVIDGAGGV
jgi:hypothetical protein